MTQSPWTPLLPGTALTRWEMALPVETFFPGTARPMADKVNYTFRNGWVDTGDLPCREALRHLVRDRVVRRPDCSFPDIFVGLSGTDADFSQFCHQPTLIQRAFRCRLSSDRAATARFRVATCGAVHLWAGDAPPVSFEPFARNTPRTTEVALAIPAGESTLTLLLEDLHERDTTCFFALTFLEGPEMKVAVPAAGDPDDLAEAEKILAGLRTDSVFYEEGVVSLCAGFVPSGPVTLQVAGMVPFARGGLTVPPGAAKEITVTLSGDAAVAPLSDVADAAPGCLSLLVTVQVGQARLTRPLGTTILARGTVLPDDPAARRAKAAGLIAAGRGFDPSVAALLLARGEGADQADAVIRAALTTIERRDDCSDFSILPLLRIWRDNAGRLEPALAQRLQQAILGYRYWLDEPGNDVMWFWSENHVLCFHAAQMIAGGLFPGQVFTNSGKTGQQLRAEAGARLQRWFASVSVHGLCEWNSAAYYPIDLLALLTLHDMEPALRGDCSALMDRIFVMTGLHCSGGTPAGSQGRCYEKELLAGPATELGSVAAIAFGGRFTAGYDRAAALLCLSDYVPPAAAARFARLSGPDWLEARYTQGQDHAGRLTLWKSRHGQLSTVTDLNTGQQGHQAQVLDVQLAAHPMARLWINHPGELKPWGDRRPSLLAGSHVMPRVAQYGPTACMIFDLARPWTDIGFTQLFAAPGAFDPPRRVGGWWLFTSGGGMVAAWCSRPAEGVEGLYKGAILRAHGLRTAWVVCLPLPEEGRAAFEARLTDAVPAFDEGALTLTCTAHDGRQLALSFGGDLNVGGQRRAFGPLSVQPHLGWNGAALKELTDLKDRRE